MANRFARALDDDLAHDVVGQAVGVLLAAAHAERERDDDRERLCVEGDPDGSGGLQQSNDEGGLRATHKNGHKDRKHRVAWVERGRGVSREWDDGRVPQSWSWTHPQRHEACESMLSVMLPLTQTLIAPGIDGKMDQKMRLRRDEISL